MAARLGTMRPPKILLLLGPLLEQPHFTSKDARERGASSAALNHYLKTGRLKRLRRGVYQSADYQNPLAFQWEDLIAAVGCVRGGVICLISALAVYHLTDEVPRMHWIAIRHGTSVKSIPGIKILRYRDLEMGKTEIELEGTKVPIFDRERTIVDAFRVLSKEIAIKALKEAVAKGGKDRIDLVKLQDYGRRLQVDIGPYLMSVTT
jgi:predicted transcriptional regulator of viral defense system